MCMKLNVEKIFLANLQGFDLHIAGRGYTVSFACSQFLVSFLNVSKLYDELQNELS